MAKKIPSLNCLRFLEAVGRLASFTKAAAELRVTQGAVSRQIKLLEDFFGKQLLHRHKNNLTLTETGKILYSEIAPLLGRIDAVTEQVLSDDRSNLVAVNILPSLSIGWLIPRIEAFKQANKGITLEIISGSGQVNFSASNTDFMIRHGFGEWPGMVSDVLIEEEIIAIASPKTLKTAIKKPEDFLKYELLEHTLRAELWQEWFAEIRLKSNYTKNIHHSFEHFFMLIKAASDGLGIALVPSFLVRREIASGELVKAFDKPYKTGRSYYLVYPKHKLRERPKSAFRSWILREFKSL